MFCLNTSVLHYFALTFLLNKSIFMTLIIICLLLKFFFVDNPTLIFLIHCSHAFR